MYIDGVIAMSLVVIVLMIIMMVYIYRYANKHIAMDEKKAKQADGENDITLPRHH
jgi:uncharacterized membrane protein